MCVCPPQTLVVKVCGVICSVVGGLAVGKVKVDPHWLTITAKSCQRLPFIPVLLFTHNPSGRAHDSLWCCCSCRSLPGQEHLVKERLQGQCVCVCVCVCLSISGCSAVGSSILLLSAGGTKLQTHCVYLIYCPCFTQLWEFYIPLILNITVHQSSLAVYYWYFHF